MTTLDPIAPATAVEIPRYAARKLFSPFAGQTHGAWDSTANSFVVNETFATWSGAVTGAGRLNRAYAEAMRP